MIDPEIKEKIIQMRLDGFTWREIKEKFNLGPNAQTGIYKAKWFLEGMALAKQKRREEEKKRKKEGIEESHEPTDEDKKKKRKTVDKQIEKHIKSSDKAPADIKKKEPVGPGKSKETEEKKEKSSFGLWAILIIALVIGVVMIIFLLKSKKAEVKETEEEKPKSRGFEDRSIEDL